jgi:hypothetical protein
VLDRVGYCLSKTLVGKAGEHKHSGDHSHQGNDASATNGAPPARAERKSDYRHCFTAPVSEAGTRPPSSLKSRISPLRVPVFICSQYDVPDPAAPELVNVPPLPAGMNAHG